MRYIDDMTLIDENDQLKSNIKTEPFGSGMRLTQIGKKQYDYQITNKIKTVTAGDIILDCSDEKIYLAENDNESLPSYNCIICIPLS